MRIFLRFALPVVAAGLTAASSTHIPAQDSAKKTVRSTNDLPRFTYPLSSPPSVMLMAGDATFNTFAQKVAHDIDSVLSNYVIDDKAILRSLYSTKLKVEMLANDNQAALATMQPLKDLQEKPEARAALGLLDHPLIEARIASHSIAGEDFEKEFEVRLQAALNSAEWPLVQGRVKSIRRSLEVATPELLAGSEKAGLDPAGAKTNTVDLAGAETMIEDRVYVKVIYPVKAQALPLLTAFIAAQHAQ